MKLQISTGEIDTRECDTFFVNYMGNDLMNGIYVDMEERYIFISAHQPQFEQMAPTLSLEGTPVVNYTGEVDYESEPHNYILASMGRIIVNGMEEALYE